MAELTIAYVLDGKRPGYNFTGSTQGFSDRTLKTIWQQAMPRGQGWRQYIGAQSLKCFPIEGGRRVAVSEVTVTDQEDESGRRGIRRAVITILDSGEYYDYLMLQLVLLPEAVREAAETRLTFWRWKQIMDRAAPKVQKHGGQIVLSAPFTAADDWLVMEGVILTVASSMRLRVMQGWPPVLPLTTLALDHREESRLIAVPAERLAQLNGLRAIDVS